MVIFDFSYILLLGLFLLINIVLDNKKLSFLSLSLLVFGGIFSPVLIDQEVLSLGTEFSFIITLLFVQAIFNIKKETAFGLNKKIFYIYFITLFFLREFNISLILFLILIDFINLKEMGTNYLLPYFRSGMLLVIFILNSFSGPNDFILFFSILSIVLSMVVFLNLFNISTPGRSEALFFLESNNPSKAYGFLFYSFFYPIVLIRNIHGHMENMTITFLESFYLIGFLIVAFFILKVFLYTIYKTDLEKLRAYIFQTIIFSFSLMHFLNSNIIDEIDILITAILFMVLSSFRLNKKIDGFSLVLAIPFLMFLPQWYKFVSSEVLHNTAMIYILVYMLTMFTGIIFLYELFQKIYYSKRKILSFRMPNNIIPYTYLMVLYGIIFFT